MRNVGAPFTITATVILMILVATVPSISISFDTALPFIIVGVIAVLIIIESKAINKIGLLFPLIFFCMLLTASTELGTNQWIDALLEEKGINAMIVLVWVAGIMAVGRFFAGGLIHRLNPIGVLLGSSVISVIGLYLLSIASGPVFTLAAAAVFAVGVCYFWPTMIGVTSEYIPKSGALGMSILGGAGFVATSMILPIMGKSIDLDGGQITYRNMMVLPIILIIAFVGLYMLTKNKRADS